MKKFIITFSLLTIISCTTKQVFIEDIPFLYDNNNAQPNLVSSNGTLSLSWISSKEEIKPPYILVNLKKENGLNPKQLLMVLTGLLIGLISQLMQLTRI